MHDELWENTKLLDATFPINIFHLYRPEHHTETLRIHWHEHYEILHVLEGETVFHINGNRLPAEPGDILFVNSGELHAGYADLPNAVRFDAIVFHQALLAPAIALGTSMAEISMPASSEKRRYANLVKRDHPQHGILKRTIEALTEEFDAKKPGYEQAVRGYCILFFAWLNRWFTAQQGDERQLERLKRQADRLKPLFHHLEKHFAEKITVTQAAALVHLSPYHFCKVFKELTGSTFIQFTNQQRLREADLLLQGTSLPVAEIAERTGFDSVQRFSKLYKQVRGHAPSRQRK